MNHHGITSGNQGVVNLGGSNHMSGNAVGYGASVTNSAPVTSVDRSEPTADDPSWDVGVITILPKEMKAVIDEFELGRSRKVEGLFFNSGEAKVTGGTVNLVATRTLGPGQRSVMGALDNLRRHFDPRLWILVGVGGGLWPERTESGDVVVSTSVVYYDQRKIMAGGREQRRGEAREAPATVTHAVNAYFTDHGEPAIVHSQDVDGDGNGSFRVVSGLLGSGEAVVADADSDVRRWLRDYNDKILAVDMEAGGLSQFWQENSTRPGSNPAWAVVRGISDHADRRKSDDFHDTAARNAARTVRELLPYLC